MVHTRLPSTHTHIQIPCNTLNNRYHDYSQYRQVSFLTYLYRVSDIGNCNTYLLA